MLILFLFFLSATVAPLLSFTCLRKLKKRNKNNNTQPHCKIWNNWNAVTVFGNQTVVWKRCVISTRLFLFYTLTCKSGQRGHGVFQTASWRAKSDSCVEPIQGVVIQVHTLRPWAGPQANSSNPAYAFLYILKIQWHCDFFRSFLVIFGHPLLNGPIKWLFHCSIRQCKGWQNYF